jgi:hypothetical protein
MMNEDLRYIIFDYNEVANIDFNEVLETSAETLRLSADGLRTFVKWIGNTPECITNIQSKSIVYNNEEMMHILDQLEWVGKIKEDYIIHGY